MPNYRGFEYFKDKDSLWKVKDGESVFVVALDDSKIGGNKKIIESRNTEQACKEYIDWFLS